MFSTKFLDIRNLAIDTNGKDCKQFEEGWVTFIEHNFSMDFSDSQQMWVMGRKFLAFLRENMTSNLCFINGFTAQLKVNAEET